MKNTKRNIFELKFKPDTVFLAVAISMWGATLIIPSFDAPLLMRALIGILLALVGMGIVLVAGALFYRARTTVEPTQPHTTSTLVVSGLYGITRNPMYVGMTLILLGLATLLLNWVSYLLVIVFVAYIWRFQIIPEERALYGLFHDEYASYTSRTRRWL